MTSFAHAACCSNTIIHLFPNSIYTTINQTTKDSKGVTRKWILDSSDSFYVGHPKWWSKEKNGTLHSLLHFWILKKHALTIFTQGLALLSFSTCLHCCMLMLVSRNFEMLQHSIFPTKSWVVATRMTLKVVEIIINMIWLISCPWDKKSCKQLFLYIQSNMDAICKPVKWLWYLQESSTKQNPQGLWRTGAVSGDHLSLVGNGPSHPLAKFRGHFWHRTCPWHVLKMSQDIFAKKSMAPKSFEDICPILSFLEDIVSNLNNSYRKNIKNK